MTKSNNNTPLSIDTLINAKWQHIESELLFHNINEPEIFEGANDERWAHDKGQAEASCSSTYRAVLENGDNLEFSFNSEGGVEGDYSALFDIDLNIAEAPEFSLKLNNVDVFCLLDSDDDEIDDESELGELYNALVDENAGISVTDASDVLPKMPAPELIEDGDASDNEMFIIERFNAPDIKFFGEELASVNTQTIFEDRARWTELNLYKTSGGKFVGEEIGRSKFIGEKTLSEVSVCESLDEVIAFFGHGPLASDLYKQANIEDIEIID